MMVFEKSEVAAVIVSFEPDDRLKEVVTNLSSQVGKIWLVDNGSMVPPKSQLMGGWDSDELCVNLILNKENLGLAAAHNQGIKAALDSGYSWVLLLDQDSIPSEQMVVELLNAACNSQDQDRIGMLCPRHEDDRDDVPLPTYSMGSKYILKRYVIQPGEIDSRLAFAMSSGCLIPSKRFREIGLMAEDFCIDYVDYDFSFRIRKAGYRIIGVGSAMLRHRLGDRYQHFFFGYRLSFSFHPAFRRYTMYRNRIRVMRTYGVSFPEFLIFEALSISKDLIKLIFLEPDKVEKFKAIFKGIFDGLFRPRVE